MLKIKDAARVGSASRLPASTTLGVSWLNGTFCAQPLHRGTLGTPWTAPTPVNSSRELAAAFREATAKTGFEGTHVVLVFNHPRLAHHWIEVPSGRQSQLQRYFHRQAQQHKPFEGPAVWASQPTLSTKTSGGALLHLLPRQVHDELVSACESAGLHLAALVPLNEALRNHLGQIPLRSDEVALLATDTGSTTAITVAQGDGTPLLARTINESWNGEAKRLAVDLNRTLLFAQQQFGRAVSAVWLLGPDAERHATEMQGFFEVPVKSTAFGLSSQHWAEEALRLPVDSVVNLVTREQKTAPTRKVIFRLSALVAVAMLLISGSLAAYVNHQYKAEIAAIRELRNLEDNLQNRHRELQRIHEGITRQERFVSELGSNETEPVAAWFLGYLSEAVPDDLVVTNVVIRSETNLWRVSLSGTVQPAAVASGRGDLLKLSRQFTNQLSKGPFAVTCLTDLPDESDGLKVTGLTTAYAVWASKMKSLAVNRPLEGQRFQVEGVMR